MKELRYGLVAVAVIGVAGSVVLQWFDKAVSGEFYGLIGTAVGALAGIAVGRHEAKLEQKDIPSDDPKDL